MSDSLPARGAEKRDSEQEHKRTQLASDLGWLLAWVWRQRRSEGGQVGEPPSRTPPRRADKDRTRSSED